VSDRSTPVRIGLTGGIASGKSTVADLFAELGAIVIDTDVIARQVVEPGKPALAEIRAAFGPSAVGKDGRLDRAAMRRLIFADPPSRRRLEAIIHPRIGDEVRRQAESAGGKYQIIVVPLLVESQLRSFMDRILVVDCDEETQVERLLRRDAETESQARSMLAAQASRAERLAIADDVIDNSGALDATRARVAELHEIYRSLT
jgi:dephospho-CoA kinase